MKNLKFLLVAGLMAVSAPAFAQFANTGNANNTSSSSAALTESYNRLSISYNPMTIAPDRDNMDNASFTGIALQYTRGISLSSRMPVFIETGLKVGYYFKSDDMNFGDFFNDDAETVDGVETKYTGIQASIPINLAYKFALPNSEVSITPFIGLNLKYNIVSKYKTEFSEQDDDSNGKDDKDGYYGGYYGDGDEDLSESGQDDKEVDLFDKKEAGGKDSQHKRFQFGWNIGAGLNYKALYLGVSYGSDFTELCKKTKTSNWAVSVGYNF